ERGAGAGRHRRGGGELRRGRPGVGGAAEPDAAPARVRPRRAAHAGGVGGRHRLPHPHRAHHRRAAAGVRAPLRRAGAVDAHRRHQRAGRPAGHGVDGVRAVLRRGRAARRAGRRHRGRRRGRALPGERARHRRRRRPGAGGAHRGVGGRRRRLLRRAVRRRPHRRAGLAGGGPGRGVRVLVGAPVGLPDPRRRSGGRPARRHRSAPDAPGAPALHGHRARVPHPHHPRVRGRRRAPGRRRRVRSQGQPGRRGGRPGAGHRPRRAGGGLEQRHLRHPAGAGV
ncbi:MAG: Catechol 1,2-dioxygenase 1, partial [uncultured Pseudonocardia sp.]